ncbi:HTH domain-containing protein [Gracilibacillus massiliensis]|uniref:HTH domain-containing protein n=1 Tax=Gracilibacillus massiliensis TaxID=1564956 RepID=UPI00071D5C29|nr:HTH domain-containing protein [Gracilibacillus massiliensis]
MGVHYFSDKQAEELRKNPYVDKVSNKAITYSDVFKQHFKNELDLGKFPTQIFREAGFDTKVVGQERIKSFSHRVRKMAEREAGFTDLRAHHSGRVSTKERTPDEEIAYLKHQVTIQKQQIEALKKMNFIDRKAAKALHKKNINLSKH